MYTKEYFLDRFRQMETKALIQNALRGLTDEAIEATRDILIERGVEGYAFELQVSDARRDLIERAGVTNQCDYCGKGATLSAIRQGIRSSVARNAAKSRGSLRSRSTCAGSDLRACDSNALRPVPAVWKEKRHG